MSAFSVNTNYEFVPVLQRATIADYSKLFSNAFQGGNKLTEAYLRWQYLDNPHGEVIGFDAFTEGELVAHYAIIPRCYSIRGRTVRAALSVNTATRSNHRGKRLFTSLADLTYASAKNMGLEFILGVANKNSIGGFLKWLKFEQIGYVRLNIGFSSLLPVPDKLNIDSDANWLNWRLRNPSRKYEAFKHMDGTKTIRTWINKVPFGIYRYSGFDGDQILNLNIKKRSMVPCLIPNFGADVRCVLQLPLKLQPSPWYVIWRPICSKGTANLASEVQIDGLAMDTF